MQLTVTPASVQETFAVTGICPYNPQAIDTTQLLEASFNQRNGENESDEQVKTCDKCGHFLSNPLIKRELIPASLADVLMPPPVKPTEAKRKKRVVAEGRLISGEDMLKQLKRKKILRRRKVEDIERRKKEREVKKEKRLEKEEERRAKKKKREEEKELKLNEKRRKAEQRKEKRKEKEANPAAAAALMAGMYVCEVCGLHGLVDDEVNGRFWFGCDEELCQRWYHEECLTDCERMYVRESLEEGGDKWFCKRCKSWLYEEE